MQVSKYHGLGNDFVIADLRDDQASADDSDEPPSVIQQPAVVVAVCDRHFGVGADGVIAILPPVSPGAHARMRVLNADGGEAEMCGNGLRCVAKHLFERDPKLRLKELVIDTGAGPLVCAVTERDGQADQIAVDMGRPRLRPSDIPMTGPSQDGDRVVAVPLEVASHKLAITCVSMGNPHAVAFVAERGDELMTLARSIGPAVETHPWFPRRTNAEFAHIHDATHIELVVWERGVGITLACGTGACATAVAACLTGAARTGEDIQVSLPGGPLSIRVEPDFSRVIMTGPARHVFDTDLRLAALVSGRN